MERPKVNGADKNTIIIIDSDDEDPPPNGAITSHGPPTFEDEEEEYDASDPYLPILQHLDLPLGGDVLNIAFPYVPSESARDMAASLPPILLQKIVVAATCFDNSVRLITLPLVPPSPASKLHIDLRSNLVFAGNGKGPHGTQILTLSGNAGHQTIPSDVSITYTSMDVGREEDEDLNVGKDGGDKPQSPSRTRRRSPSKNIPKAERSLGGPDWGFLLASHSPEISGMLLLYRIPIIKSGSGSDSDYTLSSDNLTPFQIQYLPSPAIGITFNPSLYPSTRHSQLLLACAEGTVKIYDCVLPHSLRGNNTCSWLMSLHSPADNHSSTPSRKRIVNAAWVLGGKGIMVLLADGEWGIWDLEGTMSEATTGSKRRGSGTSGVPTTFALSGWLGSTASSAPKSSNSKVETKSKLAPMTPGTRRVREEVLFAGPPTNETYHLKGGISVTKFDDPKRENTASEAVTLWHGTKVLTIPNLHSYWGIQVAGKGTLFGRDSQAPSTKIHDLNLGGELASSVDQLPPTATNRTSPSHRDLVISAEHRLVFLTAPLQEPEPEDGMPSPARAEKPDSTDQQLLARGELDVGGMERILAGMTHGRGNGNGAIGDFPHGARGKRKVLFADLSS